MKIHQKSLISLVDSNNKLELMLVMDRVLIYSTFLQINCVKHSIHISKLFW